MVATPPRHPEGLLGGCPEAGVPAQQGPGLGGRRRPLKGLVEVARGPQARDVPGVGLAQPTRRARVTESLDRPLYRSVELREHLVAGRLRLASADQPLE